MKSGMRANAVPETALVISFTLLVLYATIQLATTAFYQISADGATFVAAHDTVASVGNPSNANLSSAKTSGTTAFDKIVSSSISALNPNASTYETDVSQQVPGITALGAAAPLTITSRLIEASSGTASASPLSNCAQGALNIVNGASSLLSNSAVGLLQGGTLLSVASLNGNANSTLNLNTVPVTTRLTTLTSLASSLCSSNPCTTSSTGLVPTLQAIPGLINSLASVPLVGSLLSAVLTPLKTAIASDLQAPIASAFAGTFSPSSSLIAINAQLTTQVPSVASLLSSVIDPIVLTGGAAATGILGSNGPLVQLSSAASALKTIDSGAVTCP